MCSAASPFVVPSDDLETLPVSELVARFTAEELFSASRENSSRYNGLVLVKALSIAQKRLRFYNLSHMAKVVGAEKNRFYRWSEGRPVSTAQLERNILELASFLAIYG